LFVALHCKNFSAMLFVLLYNMISPDIYLSFPSFLMCKTNSSFIFQEEDNQSAIENDAELNKSLNKQRKRAVAAARGGRRSFASRNSYKDKGGKSSQNSRIQKQLCSW
jgi:hypothetical protein